VYQRHIHPGVVHLGNQALRRVRHVHHRRHHVLLDVILAVHSPLERAMARGPEVDVVERVEAPSAIGIRQTEIIGRRPIPLSPSRHEVSRHAKLQVTPELLWIVKAAVASQVGKAVGVTVVDHDYLR
jgi:hypothetical protein